MSDEPTPVQARPSPLPNLWHRYFQMSPVKQREEIASRTYTLAEVREIVEYWLRAEPDYQHADTGYAGVAIGARRVAGDVLLLLDRLVPDAAVPNRAGDNHNG